MSIIKTIGVALAGLGGITALFGALCIWAPTVGASGHLIGLFFFLPLGLVLLGIGAIAAR
jgi:hypothetical protein